MKALYNSRGVLTVDFIFSLVLVLGISGILFALSLTSAMVEVAQYISFASARNYYAGHFSPDTQREQSKKKYDQLLQKKALQPIFTRSLFGLKYVGAGLFQEYPEQDPGKDVFIGSRLEFEGKILNIKIPFFGSTEGGSSFKANVQSFLGREVSFSECFDFLKARGKAIEALNTAYANRMKPESVLAFGDNGC